MTGKQIVNIADLDCIYLTYDEPRKEQNWIKIQNMVPWAKRVDGIKGSDAAHKAAAAASDTDRFILIDGDNIPEADFFNLQLQLDNNNNDCVFRWKARNIINGLTYGNGGMSCWTRKFINNMRTHEASDGRNETLVEFCFDPKYWAMRGCYSTTYPNQSAFHAWRAGFREGVKMCLDRGAKPTLSEFEKRIHSRNYDHLCIWQSVGTDVEHGQDAIDGARAGTYYTMLTGWDYKLVQNFDELKNMWEIITQENANETISCALRSRLGLPIVDMAPDESRFFKHHYLKQYSNADIMERE